MKNIKIYQTNSGLGYGELAYLIRLNRTNKYLCIELEAYHYTEHYSIGDIMADSDDVIVEESNFRLEDSPLWNTFLFMEFLESYNDKHFVHEDN